MTVVQLEEAQNLLRDFKKKHGKYPDDLKQFLDEAKNYPFLHLPITGFDGWGRPFIYVSDGKMTKLISYGRDGKPGGTGLDCDLTSDYPFPPESRPTIIQAFKAQTFPMWMGSLASGLIAYIMCRVGLGAKKIELNSSRITWLVFWFACTIAGTLFVTFIMIGIHFTPVGHH